MGDWMKQISLVLVVLLLASKHARSIEIPRSYPERIITLKAGVMPRIGFVGFQADLADHLVELAWELDNVRLKFEKTPMEELYTPNLALISPDCLSGETREINGTTYNCDDFDFIMGDFYTTPDRYTRVDNTPALLTSSITTLKKIEKTIFPNVDASTLDQAKREGVPVCALEGTYEAVTVAEQFPDLEILLCGQPECIDLLRKEECLLYATDELELRYLQTQFPEFEVTGGRLSRQLIAWPVRKSLDTTVSFLLNKWIYAAITDGFIDELYFEYFEKKLCPLGSAGIDCELPCDPDHGASDAQGRCICESIRWTGDDCGIEVQQEMNMIPPTIKAIAYFLCIFVVSGYAFIGIVLNQPFFLCLVLFGCLVSTSAILPMAQEDEGGGLVEACVAIPWLYSLGFSITFGTLFAKIRRVYGIFSFGHERSSRRNFTSTRRAELSFRNTLVTIGKVLVLDVVILMLWSAVEPLHWNRTVIREDQFGFPLESEGYCTSDNWEMFLGAIIALHVALCAIACYMCFVARNIPSTYSEHKYLTIAMVSNLQVFAIGVPVLIIAGGDPAAQFFVRSAIVWMNDFVVLALIFGNLMIAVHKVTSGDQVLGSDKGKVSEAVRTIAQRRASVTGSTKNPCSPLQMHRNSNSCRREVMNIDSDLESGSAIEAPCNSRTPVAGTSSFSEKKPVASELTLSGFFETSNHDPSTIVLPASNSVRSGDSAARWEKPRDDQEQLKGPLGPSIPIRGETTFEEESEVTISEFEDQSQVLRSRPGAREQHASPLGPTIPIRGETIFEKESEANLSGLSAAPNNDELNIEEQKRERSSGASTTSLRTISC